jgi:hypothetical protein
MISSSGSGDYSVSQDLYYWEQFSKFARDGMTGRRPVWNPTGRPTGNLDGP